MNNKESIYIRIEPDGEKPHYIQAYKFKPLEANELNHQPDHEFLLHIVESRYLNPKNEEWCENENINIPISFKYNPVIFALVDDGWLPPVFVVPKLYLIDRNILSSLMKSESKNEYSIKKEWWLSIFESDDTSGGPTIEINTLFVAIEGEHRKYPNFLQFISEEKIANEIVKNFYKKIKITTFSTEQKEIIHSHFKNKNYSDLFKFTQKSIGYIINPIKKNKKHETLLKIIELSKNYNLAESRHIVILILSCLYGSSKNPYNFARKIIKPQKSYKLENFYNSISDLSFIELMLLLKRYNSPNYSGLTADRHLAYYWSRLKPKINYESEHLSYTFSISNELFEDASPEELVVIRNLLSTL